MNPPQLNRNTSVILTIYNQEKIIKNIIEGILYNISNSVNELIFVLDGCTDNSETILLKTLAEYKNFIETKIIYTPNLNETLANNVGMKMSTNPFLIIVQDDCFIKEKDFDNRLYIPFCYLDNLLGVSGRDAVDITIENGGLKFYNIAGKDANTPRNIFSIRDTINRGPIMFNHEILKSLNYLDEEFAPLAQDDSDLCLRAYKKGYVAGSYAIDYVSDLSWGATRSKPDSYKIFEESEKKNFLKIIERHSDLLLGEKHSRELTLG